MKLSITFQTVQFGLFIIFVFSLPAIRPTRAENMGSGTTKAVLNPCNESQPSPTLELIAKPEIYAELPVTTPQAKVVIRCSANYSLRIGLYNSDVNHGTRSHLQERLEPLGKFIASHERSASHLIKLEVALLLREGDYIVLCYSTECNHTKYQTGMRIGYHNFTFKASKNIILSSVDIQKNVEGRFLMMSLLLAYGLPLVLLVLVIFSLLALTINFISGESNFEMSQTVEL